MSKTVKFEHARFYDDDLGEDVLITPREFNEDRHGGNIECTTTNCHGSLSYVAAYEADADLENRDEHFRTNPHGQGHEKDCPLNPDPSIQASRRMIEEIEDGKFIVLNVNFPTSYSKEKATLRPKRAREVMPKIGGSYRPDWKKANKGNYAPYAGSTAERLKDHASMFREALSQAAQGDKSQLVVASLHGEGLYRSGR